MRYFIESKDDEGNIGRQIQKWSDEGKIEIIEKGDPIEEIKSNILKIQRAFEYLRKAGINEEVMKAYIRTKGLSLKQINEVLHAQDEFFRKLGIKK